MLFFISATLPPLLGSQLDVSKVMTCEYTEEPAVFGRQANQLRCERLITPAMQKAVKFVDRKSPYDEADSKISPSIDSVRSNVGLESVAMESFLTPSGKLQQ